MRKGGTGWDARAKGRESVGYAYGGRHALKVTPSTLEALSRAKKLHRVV